MIAALELHGFDALIAAMGFSTLIDVRTKYGIGGLFPNASRRTGVYLLVLADGRFYIGQAKDVVRRFGQHRKHFGDRLIGISFQRVALRVLNDVERQLIQDGERAGLPLEQVEWKSHVYGSADLDALFDADEYQSWRRSPRAHFDADPWIKPVFEAGRSSRDLQTFRKFRMYPLSAELMSVLASFIACCIPAAKRTSPDYWNIACLPSTNRSFAPRLVCISSHVMEVLVVGHEPGDKESIWGFVVCARSPLESRYRSLTRAAKSLNVDIDGESSYKSAGMDQCRISFNSLGELAALLESETVREAIALLFYNVMRKGVNRYAKFHCSTLMDALQSL